MKKVEIEQIPINNDLLNLITPQGIVLKYNKVQLGEITSKLQYVAGYPSTVNLGWLSNLKDIPKYYCFFNCYTNRRCSGLCRWCFKRYYSIKKYFKLYTK